MSEENKAVVRGLHEAIGKGDVAAIDRFYSPDAIYHGTGDMANADIDTFRQFISAIFEAFPGLSVTQELVLSDGDKVTYINTYSGTHKGDFMGIPATGKDISVRSIGIAQVSRGQIVEEWENLDELGLMQQLGVIPTE